MSKVDVSEVYGLIHELLVPVNTLGCADILKDKAPSTITEQIDVIDKTCKQMKEEILALRDNLDKRIDLRSPVFSAETIQKLALSWKSYEATFSDAIDQIQGSGAKMGEPLLDDIMNETLPRGLKQLKDILAFLATVRPEYFEQSIQTSFDS
jgi:hypothetical protein